MVIVDSSVWVDFFNGRNTTHTAALAVFINDDTARAGDYIVMEVLRGFRSDKEHATATAFFGIIKSFQLLDLQRAARAADRYRALRKRGVTVRKPVDSLIASYCIDEGHELLAKDKDFLPYVKHFGLRLLPLPTT